MTKLPDDLEAFVSKEVASLCDADPTVLAQYIVALIGHDELNEALKLSLQEKLHEFFDDQTMPFIDRLFQKINSSNEAPSTSAAAAAMPTTADRFDLSDEEDDDRNFKHRRQRSPEEQDRGNNKRRLPDDNSNNTGSSSKYYRSSEDNRRSGYNNNNGGYDNRGRGGYNNNRGGRGGRGGNNNSMNRSRPQCRDYNEKGFCMRGDMCPYDHGMDRIIVDEAAANGGFPGPFPPGGPIPPMGVRAVPPQPFFGMPGDAYDPERSGMMPNPDMNFPGMMMPNEMMMNNGMMRGGGRGGGRGGRGGRGGGRGGYNNNRHNQHNNSQNTTLVVEKIPAENCQISTVNDFFAKFGTITNISVQPQAQKAIIQYSTRAEAENAYSSPDAIFDNRFVKVYWHKDDTNTANASNTPLDQQQQQQQQQQALPKSNEPDPELVAARAAELAKEREEKQKKHQEHMKSILELQKKRESQLQQQIDEQKRLLAKLTNSAGMSQAEKAELLKALKSIQNDIDTSKSQAANPAPSATAAAATGEASGEAKEGAAETSEDLKKKLARLEAEAATLGIHGAGGFRGGRGGYYGRGRGSWPRMRGGMTRMSLDNRPTKIVVKDIPQDSTEIELRQHFEQYGTLTSFEQKESEVLIQYGQRFEAEKAMNAGPNYSKGTLQLAWITDAATPATANAASSTTEES